MTREPSASATPPPRRRITRRQLLGAGALAAVGVAAGTRALTDRLPAPEPLAVPPAPPRSRGFRRGVNSYTLAYASVDSRAVGERATSYAFLAGRGHRLVRLPFDWGLMQPRLGGPLDERFLAAVEAETAAITAAGMQVVIDVHNSGRHPTKHAGQRRFGRGISEQQFIDLWLRLSDRFGDDRRIYAYDLMNEPFALPDAVWQQYSQGVVEALRNHGDRSLLWIQGNEYALAGVWREHQPVPWIEDPLDHHAYSAHTYPGSTAVDAQRAPDESDQTAFLSDLRDFVDWLHQYGVRGSIGEVGWPSERHVGRKGAAEWNRLGNAWFDMADRAELDVTYFGTSSAYDNWLWAYDAPVNALSIPGVSVAESQASVIEAHPSRAHRTHK